MPDNFFARNDFFYLLFGIVYVRDIVGELATGFVSFAFNFSRVSCVDKTTE